MSRVKDKLRKHSFVLAALALFILLAAAAITAGVIGLSSNSSGGRMTAGARTTASSEVPDLVGLQQREARVCASSAKLRVITVAFKNGSSPAGAVLSQSPKAGRPLLVERIYLW